jgi:lysophospholipase L1-like esterase
MRKSLVACLILAAWSLHAAEPAAPEKGSAAELKKSAAWSFEPDPKLPNVLILGDSISIGYTLQVRELLKGKANVYRPVTRDGNGAENCSGTTFGVKSIDRWLGAQKWDVIHFNFGLHDLKHVKKPGDDLISPDLSDPQQATAEQYRKNLEEIVKKLKGTGAKLIFATTTPVPEGAKGRTPDMPPKYNEVALKVMQENGILVDDLFALVEPNVEKYQLPKDVHYKPAGYKALAQQVAGMIEKELGS